MSTVLVAMAEVELTILPKEESMEIGLRCSPVAFRVKIREQNTNNQFVLDGYSFPEGVIDLSSLKNNAPIPLCLLYVEYEKGQQAIEDLKVAKAMIHDLREQLRPYGGTG